MGSTLDYLVTSLCDNNDNIDYGLWEAAQIVVLLSRTRYAKNLMFVGNREATINAILNALSKPHPHLTKINNLIERLCNENQTPVIIPHPTIYRPRDATIPALRCVYLLVSTKFHDITYIGETDNLSRRLYQHNLGKGSSGTRIAMLMPWALIAYVVGFETRQSRQMFEARWQQQRPRRRTYGNTTTMLLDHALQLMSEWQQRHPDEKLNIVQCGEIISANDNND